MSVVYPKVARENVVETLHGHQIADPYRWLENPDSDQTKQFVEEQNKITFEYLKKSSYRDKCYDTITKLTDYPRYGCPSKKGDSYYYFHNSGLLPQSVLYKQDSLDQPGRVFFDPNKFSTDGTVSLSGYSFSESGKYFAYTLSDCGSDWVKIYVRSTQDGEETPIDSPLEWVKFTSLSWSHDDKGIFYKRYPAPSVSADKAGTETDRNSESSIWYHTLGTSQKDDILVFKDSDKDTQLATEVSEDGKYLFLYLAPGCDPKKKVYYLDLNEWLKEKKPLPEFSKIVDVYENDYDYIANDDNIIWFLTSLDAPKKRICKYDLKEPSKGFVEVIPESDDVLNYAFVINHDKLLVSRLHHVKDVVMVYNLYTSQELYQLPLPLGSMISQITGKRDHTVTFYSFSSFLSPGTTYLYDFKTNQHSVYRETKVNGLRADELETHQIFYKSKDGTTIPMYLIHKKGLSRDGNNPTILYGYGGFNISMTPFFSVNMITWVQHFNGIFAIANIRGGSEYGQEKWYHQGRLHKKQNCFDDFQYAAKYLISENYTSPKKLAINGGSNGGLLVGACINQAPELFGCAVAEVGVLDVLRFHKFTIGAAWISDYGNPDKEEDFHVALKYSPLHNVKKQEYPSVLIMTGDHDDRVVPLHSLKFLATLQYVCQDNQRPLLGRIDTKSGHGAGKSTQQRIQEATDKFCFIAHELGATWVE